MKSEAFSSNHTLSAYVKLDTRKCKACWKCMEKCPKNVIGRINLPWHKHARIVNGSNCTGCMNCVKICQDGAFSIPGGAKQEAVK